MSCAVVTYAKPNITQVEGCKEREDCKREGGDKVTLVGENFGAGGAQVLLNGEACDSVTHDDSDPHRKLVCVLPKGKGLNRGFSVIQLNGKVAFAPPRLSISYALCDAGQFDNATLGACSDCPAGTFSAQPNLLQA